MISILVGSFVPFGGTLLYPFTLLATWVHEMGHGIASLLSGGGFEQLEIFANASGLAHTRHAAGVVDGIVSLGGLVAPPIVGAVLLVGARGPARAQALLIALASALVVSLFVWVRSAAGLIAIPIVAAVIVVVVRYGSGRERMILAQFVGLRLALDTLGRGLDYLASDTARVDGVERQSDIARVAVAFGGPRILWTAIVSAFCIALVAAGLYAAWRTPRELHGRRA